MELRYVAEDNRLGYISRQGSLSGLCSSYSALHTSAGRQRVQLDFHLCYAEDCAGRWAQLAGLQYCRLKHTAVLLELVYFFWFEERQLARGARMLAKVLTPG